MSPGGGASSNSYSQGPQIGPYGYTNTNQFNQNYGYNQPHATPYGYSGSNAYRPSSQGGSNTGKLLLAGGGGLAAGYVLGSWASSSSRPSSNSWWNTRQTNQYTSCSINGMSSPCDQCYNNYGAYKCVTPFEPPVNMGRDDLMDSGFIPADYRSPLVVKITKLAGSEFGASKVCPPEDVLACIKGYNATPCIVSWTPPQDSFIFVTLTQVSPLSESPGGPVPQGPVSPQQGTGILAVLALSSLALCACACLTAICGWAMCGWAGDKATRSTRGARLQENDAPELDGATSDGSQALLRELPSRAAPLAMRSFAVAPPVRAVRPMPMARELPARMVPALTRAPSPSLYYPAFQAHAPQPTLVLRQAAPAPLPTAPTQANYRVQQPRRM